ncbi:cation:dicarboxylate symporter family transporter [Candidatus Steffania adelgidicola]|uniref:cation:dicarboxylate symporter family transporter n=1 Tax=Candidatus Steffania adelgidicola TaxID=1076626 RepID=UPI002A4E12CA|nr:cation:dicarboxylase symporter family transporter [Candidatus Steffania adelgidicola]
MIFSILLGVVFHNQGKVGDWVIFNILSPVRDVFIQIIKMIVVTIVVPTLVVGIADIGDDKRFKSI